MISEQPATIPAPRPEPGPSRRRRAITAWLLLAAICVGAGIAAFRGVGRWLVVEDPLGPADVIVVLSGRMPERAMGAAELYRRGFAPEVWLTHPRGVREEMDRLGIEYTDEDTYSAAVLEKLGVPANAIRVLPHSIRNTEDEVKLVAAELRNGHKDRAIIVTSPPHTRRVRALWRKLIGPDPLVIVRYSRLDDFDAAHWWRHTNDSLSVVREALGLLNVWAGLPLRPKEE